ncbi:MAG: sugar kinase [Pontibacterium sp.]
MSRVKNFDGTEATHEPKHVAFIGECMIELSRDSEGRIYQDFAGDTLNTAVYTARLGAPDGHKVSYITAVGDDHFSHEMLLFWQREGIDTTSVTQHTGASPGLYFIDVDEKGERSFSYWRSESPAKRRFASLTKGQICALWEGVDWVYLSGISLAILPKHDREKLLDALEAFKRGGGNIAFDNNYRPQLWESIEEAQEAFIAALTVSNLALLTWDDEQLLHGYTTIEELWRSYQTLGVQEWVIKRGSEPCLLYSQGQWLEVESSRVSTVVDTTAAGDSFGAGYLASRLSGLPMVQAAVNGHLVASTVIQHRGAIIDASLVPQLVK